MRDMERNYHESVDVMRGICNGLLFVLAFWMVLIGIVFIVIGWPW